MPRLPKPFRTPSGLVCGLAILMPAVLLIGCGTTRVVDVTAPCPKFPVPPPALMVPPESPGTAETLNRLLTSPSNPTSEPADETP